MNKKKMILIGTIAILLMLLFFLISLCDKQRKIYSDEIVEWDGRIFVQLEQGSFSEDAKKNLATVTDKKIHLMTLIINIRIPDFTQRLMTT